MLAPFPPRISIKGHIGSFPYSFFDVSQCSKRRLAIHFERPPPLDRSNMGGGATVVSAYSLNSTVETRVK